MKKTLLVHSVFLLAVTMAQGAFAQTVEGNVANGEQKVVQCIGCHGLEGYQASFPEVYKVPKIAGQGAKYIAASLIAYKKGERRHPTMRGVAGNMSDQDIADVSAYYEAVGAQYKPSNVPVPTDAKALALIEKGGCKGCHGESLSKPIDPAYPKLAGQYADYLFVSLKAYKAESNGVSGRSNAIMGGIAKQFSNSELKTISNYMGAMSGDLSVVQQKKFR